MFPLRHHLMVFTIRTRHHQFLHKHCYQHHNRKHLTTDTKYDIPLWNQSPLYTQSHTLYHLRHTIISSHKHSHHTHIHHYILPKQFHPTTVKISTKYSIWYTNAPANHPSLLDEIINDNNTLWIAS